MIRTRGNRKQPVKLEKGSSSDRGNKVSRCLGRRSFQLKTPPFSAKWRCGKSARMRNVEDVLPLTTLRLSLITNVILAGLWISGWDKTRQTIVRRVETGNNRMDSERVASTSSPFLGGCAGLGGERGYWLDYGCPLRQQMLWILSLREKEKKVYSGDPIWTYQH